MVPVFFKEKSGPWLGQVGISLLLATFNHILKTRFTSRVFVFSNEEQVVSIANSMGISGYHIETTNGDGSGILPCGTTQAIGYLESVLRIHFDNLLVLNFRNPLIRASLIDQAIVEFSDFHDGKKILISIKEPEAHPCLFHSFYEILDMGLIHFFEVDEFVDAYCHHFSSRIFPTRSPKRCGEMYKLTKPFYFDWATRGIQKPSGSRGYTRIHDGEGVRYVPVEKLGDHSIDEGSPARWIHENETMARILLKIDIHQAAVLKPYIDGEDYEWMGAAFSDDYHYICSGVFKHLKKNQCVAIFDSPTSPSFPQKLRMAPLMASGLIPDKTIETNLDRFPSEILMECPDKDSLGMIYSLVKTSEEGTYELCEAFQPEECLWRTDNSNGKKINKMSGKEITGRQDFPDFFESEGSLFIMEKAAIPTVDREILSGNAKGFIIPENNSIQIESDLDLLKYRALKRAQCDDDQI